MSDLIKVHAWPALSRPVLVVCLEGWIDAGQAAGAALLALQASHESTLLASFDGDQLIDYRARRPVLQIQNGVDTELRWPDLRLDVAPDAHGRSLLLLHGPEPDMRWHHFVDEVVALAGRLSVEMVVGLGAFPAPVPHTRPVRLAATSPDPELARQVGFIPAALEVPAGAQGALEWAFGQAGTDSLGLWARVPHYVSALPYPAASAALLDRLSLLTDIPVDTTALQQAATSTKAQIDGLIAGSDEHLALVRQLEVQQDDEAGMGATDLGELPSGDELAAELERFLRGER